MTQKSKKVMRQIMGYDGITIKDYGLQSTLNWNGQECPIISMSMSAEGMAGVKCRVEFIIDQTRKYE